MKGVGNDGPINILYITTARSNLAPIFNTIKKYNPRAFVTIEGVRIIDSLSSDKTHVGRHFLFRKTNKTK